MLVRQERMKADVRYKDLAQTKKRAIVNEKFSQGRRHETALLRKVELTSRDNYLQASTHVGVYIQKEKRTYRHGRIEQSW